MSVLLANTRLSLLTMALFFCLATPCLAEQWSLSAELEHPPARPENRIIKWCNEESGHERWASANIKLQGYQPCGKLSSVSTCDAGGKRMIAGNDAARPNDHRDCGVGPRILIINHDESDTIDTSHVASDPADVTPLSSKERQDLKRDFAQAQNLQDKDPMMQMQKMADMFLQQLLGGSARDPKGSKQLDQMLKHVDPKTRDSIKQLLKQYGP